MNTAGESNVKSIVVISLVSVLLFGIFYYLITDVTNTPSSSLKSDDLKVTQDFLGDSSETEEKKERQEETVKGASTEVSVFKALTNKKADAEPKMVLSGADTEIPESTVPATGSETIFGAFVLSSLIMFTGIYLLMTQPKNTALARFEKRIIRDLD